MKLTLDDDNLVAKCRYCGAVQEEAFISQEARPEYMPVISLMFDCWRCGKENGRSWLDNSIKDGELKALAGREEG